MLTVDFFGSHKFPIDVPFGQAIQEKPVTPPDPWTEISEAVARTGNWSASLPPGSSSMVIPVQSRKTPDGVVLVDPFGGLVLRQKAAPLDHDISKFGNVPLGSAVRYSLTGITTPSFAFAPTSLSPVTDQFAAGQFEQLSDAAQLSRPSFEPMNAGVTLGGDALAFGPAFGRDQQCKTEVIDGPSPVKPYALPLAVQQAAHLYGPAAKAPSRNTGLGKYSPPTRQPSAAKLTRSRYLIADRKTLADATSILSTPQSGTIPTPDPPEKGAMMQALAAYYAAVPADRGKYAVMGAWELL